MHWIVQEDIYYEEGQRKLVRYLERNRMPHSLVKIVPFSGSLLPEPKPTSSLIVMGSVNLVRIALDRGWQPGAYYNENFQVEAWLEHYGEEPMLNGRCWIGRFGDVHFDRDEMFVRPCKDLKSFAGRVMRRDEFESWRGFVESGGESNQAEVSLETMVTVAPFRRILAEHRFFLVAGRAVAASQYRHGARRVLSPKVDESLWRYAEEIAERWSPAEAFCLDVAETEEGPRIIELNCINAAGFYAADVRPIVDALEELERKRVPR